MRKLALYFICTFLKFIDAFKIYESDKALPERINIWLQVPADRHTQGRHRHRHPDLAPGP